MTMWENTFKQKALHIQKLKIGQNPTGRYKCRNEIARLHPYPSLCVGMDDPTILSALTRLSLISHKNLLRFVGVVLDGPECCVLTDEASRCKVHM